MEDMLSLPKQDSPSTTTPPPSQSLTPRRHSTFRFLSLPREIRNSIYVYALQHQNQLPYSIYTTPSQTHIPALPSLLLLNHRINTEATPILYGNIHLLLCNAAEGRSLVAQIGQSNVRRIRWLKIYAGSDYDGWADLLRNEEFSLLGIEELTLCAYKAGKYPAGMFRARMREEIGDGVVEGVMGLFERCMRERGGRGPRLVLHGFGEGERARFPGSWTVEVTRVRPAGGTK